MGRLNVVITRRIIDPCNDTVDEGPYTHVHFACYEIYFPFSLGAVKALVRLRIGFSLARAFAGRL